MFNICCPCIPLREIICSYFLPFFGGSRDQFISSCSSDYGPLVHRVPTPCSAQGYGLTWWIKDSQKVSNYFSFFSLNQDFWLSRPRQVLNTSCALESGPYSIDRRGVNDSGKSFFDFINDFSSRYFFLYFCDNKEFHCFRKLAWWMLMHYEKKSKKAWIYNKIQNLSASTN